MKSRSWYALVVVLLLTVGCGPASQAKLTTLQKLERDYMAEQLLLEADAIAGQITTGVQRDHYQRLVRLYVPVYMANACVEESHPSVEGFNTNARGALSAGRGPELESIRVIKAINDAHDKWKSESIDAATQHCLQPYLYPESISDAGPALELLLASRVMALPFDLRDSFESVFRGMAARWFQTDQQEPFVSWMCQCGL